MLECASTVERYSRSVATKVGDFMVVSFGLQLGGQAVRVQPTETFCEAVLRAWEVNGVSELEEVCFIS